MGALRIQSNEASKILSPVPALTWEILKKCYFLLSLLITDRMQKTYFPQGGLEPALGGMESRGGIHKAHLEFHL